MTIDEEIAALQFTADECRRQRDQWLAWARDASRRARACEDKLADAVARRNAR